MSFDYNTPGREYSYLALPSEPLGTGLLSATAIDALALAQRLALQASVEGDQRGKPLGFLLSALERLEGLFLIARRLIDEFQDLPNSLKTVRDAGSGPVLVALSSQKAFVDFPSLLMNASATVDVLSKFYTGASEVNYRGNFRGSKRAIYNLHPVDIRADNLWSDLDLFDREIDIVFTGSDRFKGLRNAVAHENSVLGLSSYSFSGHLLNNRSALLFDCEIELRNDEGQIKRFALTNTTNRVVSLTTWLIYRAAICYLTRSRSGAILDASYRSAHPPARFVPVWQSPIAIFSNFISEDEADEMFSVVRIGWNGFETIQRRLSRQVFEHTIDYDGPSRRQERGSGLLRKMLSWGLSKLFRPRA